MMLSSPIILYDYPQVAPESPGDFFDGTEIDEILTLRDPDHDRRGEAARWPRSTSAPAPCWRGPRRWRASSCSGSTARSAASGRSPEEGAHG